MIGFATGGKARSPLLQADAELYAIYVRKEFQGKGVGRALVLAVVRNLVEQEFQAMGVWVLELNPYRRFYECLGGEFVTEQMIELDSLSLNEFAYRWQDLGFMLRGSMLSS